MVNVDWTELPPELLNSIATVLTIYSDYLQFRSVCRSWRSSAIKAPTHLPPQLPWLLLPSHHAPNSAALFDISADRLRHVSLAATWRPRGSSHGWLALLDDSPAILLLNPLTRSTLHLPPLSSFPNVLRFCFADIGREYALRSSFLSLRQVRDSFVKKIVLSSSPVEKNSDFVAVAVLNHSDDVAFCKRGDRSWRFIAGAGSFSEDVVFSGRLFYAVDIHGSVAVCDVSGSEPAVSIVETPRLDSAADMQYLVRSRDDLLLVSRYLDLDADRDDDEGLYRTVGFGVFRMDWGGPKWERVGDLGDRLVFIGQSSSVSFSAGDFRGYSGNCVYFTDDYSEVNYESVFGECDSGIFRLSDGSVERRWNTRFRDHWPTPIWVSPNPC